MANQKFDKKFIVTEEEPDLEDKLDDTSLDFIYADDKKNESVLSYVDPALKTPALGSFAALLTKRS